MSGLFLNLRPSELSVVNGSGTGHFIIAAMMLVSMEDKLKKDDAKK